MEYGNAIAVVMAIAIGVWTVVMVRRGVARAPQGNKEVLLSLSVPLEPVVFKNKSKTTNPICETVLLSRKDLNSAIFVVGIAGLIIGSLITYVFLEFAGMIAH